VIGSFAKDNYLYPSNCRIANMENITNNKNVYSSGLDDADWKSLRDVIWPFVHAKNPSDIAIAEVPQHLANHPLINLIKKYKETGDENYLDQAGQHLIPTNEPFGWYVPLTK
jgi:hypothetical protein